MMPAILFCALITDQTRRHVRKAESVVQFPVQQLTTVRTDGRSTKCQLDRAVKLEL